MHLILSFTLFMTLFFWTPRTATAQANDTLPSATAVDVIGERIGRADTKDVAYADLDNDGDVDALVMEWDHNEIWFNQGDQEFRKSSQSFGTGSQHDVALGDLDSDGDIDAFIIKQQSLNDNASEVWLNDGHGGFSDSGQRLTVNDASVTIDVQLSDFDQDQDLDAFVVANGIMCGVSRLWLNDGHGQFVNNEQAWPGCKYAAVLGDLDQDQKTDIIFNTNRDLAGLTVWRNLGNNTFTETQRISSTLSTNGMALGDLDSDGDLDLFASASIAPGALVTPLLYNKVWVNDGSGQLVDSGQLLPHQGSQPAFTPQDDAVTLADVDQDGDLDGITVTRFKRSPVNSTIVETTVVVRFNDGTGHFTQGSLRFLPPAAPASITSSRLTFLLLSRQLYLPLVSNQ